MLTIDPQIRLYIAVVLVYILTGVGAYYGLNQIEAEPEEFKIFFGLYSIIFLILLAIYQASTTRSRARHIADHLTSDLSQSREMFLGLFRSSPVPYLVVTDKGVITLSNTAASRLFKTDVGGLDKLNIYDVLIHEDEERLPFIAARVQGGTYVSDEEMAVRNSKGELRWVLFSAFPFGNRAEALVTLVDITKQKEIDIAKTEFVSLASHQLRTPISSIKWNIELLGSDRFGTMTETQRSLIGKIERGLVKMNNIINDFLDASQLELGTFATDASDIALRGFFDDICDEYSEKVEQKHIILTKQYGAPEAVLNTDKQLLHMIVSNLTSNAVKYTPENGSVIVRFDMKTDHVSIAVSDTGMGIPEADQGQLFSKFFRALNARDSSTEGTGLGLYIVKEAVEMLNGEITFLSVENEGTTFTVTIPR